MNEDGAGGSGVKLGTGGVDGGVGCSSVGGAVGVAGGQPVRGGLGGDAGSKRKRVLCGWIEIDRKIGENSIWSWTE
ncbi:hypothetical protein Tco_1107642 [Tanacetum coccineum]